MHDFDNAQRLFGSFQKDGEFHSLTESLDMLEDLIDRRGPDSQRATSLKKIMGKYLDARLEEIWGKGNIDEFGKHLKDDELPALFYEALDKADMDKFAKLVRIRKDYFG